jgi:zeaxanthin glucosyltransferase
MATTVALMCPPLQGHINPTSAIGDGLKEKGFTVKFIGLRDIADLVKAFEYIPIGEDVFPKGSIEKITQKMSKRKGMRMGRIWQKRFVNKWSDVVCRELPDILKRENVDFIVCDQMEAAVALVADYLKIPFVTICNAMAVVMDLTYPPFFTSWNYKITDFRLTLNNGFYTIADILLKRDTRILEKWRKEWGLPERKGMSRYFAHSKLATFSQQTPSLEFPLVTINYDWHYCGPFRNNILLPYKKPQLPQDGTTYVYVSLGSILGSRFKLLKKCVNACNALDLKPVVVHAGLLEDEEIKELEESALVFDYIKQPDIFEDCEILISHCGLNTALDALTYGRPIVAIPLGIEQGAIATKLKRAGCAIIIKRPSTKKIQKALTEIISNPQYKENCQRIQQEIKTSGGMESAVDIIYKIIEKECETVPPQQIPLPGSTEH